MGNPLENHKGIMRTLVRLKIRNRVLRDCINALDLGESSYFMECEINYNGFRILCIRRKLRNENEIHKDDEQDHQT